MNLSEMIMGEIQNGLDETNAKAKVCQDVIMKAIASGSLSRNVTIKGGVVMRSKTGSIRRATRDLDLDFIRYSLTDESLREFVHRLNCLRGIDIKMVGRIEELKQQDYHGKRIYLELSDEYGNKIKSKLDIGVHNHLDIEQEEYCFDVSFDSEGASLLINSNEQILTEKLKSLLRLGYISTRYKDIYDIYYLINNVDKERLRRCMEVYIFADPKMRENNMADIVNRIKYIFRNTEYLQRLETSESKWLDESVLTVTSGIVGFLEEFNVQYIEEQSHFLYVEEALCAYSHWNLITIYRA